jgi:hypothetical protein
MSQTKSILIVEERIVKRHTCFELGYPYSQYCIFALVIFHLLQIWISEKHIEKYFKKNR